MTSTYLGTDARPDRETRLIGLVAAGDRHAFEMLYRAYSPRLTRFLSRMTQRRSLVEEIIDDAMMVVWQRAARFDRSCKLSTWVISIAYRKACSALHALDEGRPGDADGWPADPEQQPEHLFEQACLGRALESALATLPMAQRAAFQLSFYHGMGYAEIAELMECPVNTVKTRLFHARRRLAALLAAHIDKTA